jgi:ankyrin repeat protein
MFSYMGCLDKKVIEQSPSWAISNGHEAVVKLLVGKEAGLESKNNDGRTSLSRAACNEHEAVVKLLLEKGAEVESKDSFHLTLLSWAALKHIAQLLICEPMRLGDRATSCSEEEDRCKHEGKSRLVYLDV